MTLAEYRKQLRSLYARANAAIAAGQMEEHLTLGRQFHCLADQCKEQLGVELREEFSR